MVVHAIEIEAARRNMTAEALISETLLKHRGKVKPTADELGVSTQAIYLRLGKRRKRANQLEVVSK